MSQCRSCKAAILWAKTEKGKWIPLDSEPTSDGNIILDGSVAKVIAKADLTNPDGSRKQIGAPLRTSHFATCPAADEHRRAKV